MEGRLTVRPDLDLDAISISAIHIGSLHPIHIHTSMNNSPSLPLSVMVMVVMVVVIQHVITPLTLASGYFVPHYLVMEAFTYKHPDMVLT